MTIGSLAVGFVIGPLTFVDIAIRVSKLSYSMDFALVPISLVDGAVGPALFAVAVFLVFDPVAFVYSIVIGKRRDFCVSCACRPI